MTKLQINSNDRIPKSWYELELEFGVCVLIII